METKQGVASKSQGLILDLTSTFISITATAFLDLEVDFLRHGCLENLCCDDVAQSIKHTPSPFVFGQPSRRFAYRGCLEQFRSIFQCLH